MAGRRAVSTNVLSEEDLERELTTPSSKLIEFIRNTGGDFIVLGAGGKMGPGLALMRSKYQIAPAIATNIAANKIIFGFVI